jgi:hypothetical protein
MCIPFAAGLAFLRRDGPGTLQPAAETKAITLTNGDALDNRKALV